MIGNFKETEHIPKEPFLVLIYSKWKFEMIKRQDFILFVRNNQY